MKKSLLTYSAAVLFILLNGCSNPVDPDYNGKIESLKTADYNTAISYANDWHYSAPKITSHISTTEIVFEFPDGRKITKPLPGDVMYIAFAPYLDKTHTCSEHYPSSCKGELTGKNMHVTVTDNEGKIYSESDMQTLKNGFFELWLPRNSKFLVKIDYNSRSGSELIETGNKNRTCITTIKLN